MTTLVQDVVSNLRFVRGFASAALLVRAAWYQAVGKHYRALDDFCTVFRSSNSAVMQRLARRPIDRLMASTRSAGVNTLVDAYRADSASDDLARSYAIAGNGPHDLFRDLLVLKAASPGEKGVILLKYARTFSAVVALLDVARLMERYTFVLEPCWTGYCHPALLLFVKPGHPVVVQCFTDEDYRFVESIGAPLIPVRLGPADWVDSSIFAPSASQREKSYDLVMVANWAKHKRHLELFRALRPIKRKVRVLLAGFEWGGRTAEDIRQEAARTVGDNVEIEIVEKLSADELARRLGGCKVFVFLSRKEGDNKALVEAMFANVPAIVHRETIGGARSRINPATGVLASDNELTEKILHMLEHYRDFAPRKWALANTGSAVATQMLDRAVRRAVLDNGGVYEQPIVEKVNAPNLGYKDPVDRTRFGRDYEFVLQCLRYTRAQPANDPGDVGRRTLQRSTG